ncbi:MAG: VWA domain-containing protein, partial [Actinomycetia bacterium]|nr:VWA domain-containing protein [Actinomycetes bacterium]
MRSTTPALLAFAIVAALLLPPPHTATAAQPSQLEICDADPSAPLDIVLLLDESGSIDDADPNGLRTEAVNAFLFGLADLAVGASSGTPRDIDVYVAMFNTQTTTVVDWRPLADRRAASEIGDTIETAWANPTGDTNQVLAFEDGLNRLEERTGRCRIMVMFTDGVIDTGPGNAEADVALAESEACRARHDDGSPTVSERANNLDVYTFVLLLEPKAGGNAFLERLSATMTLFSSIT